MEISPVTRYRINYGDLEKNNIEKIFFPTVFIEVKKCLVDPNSKQQMQRGLSDSLKPCL